ncbi:MAG: 3-octaprenyl-4-hydroxybenzoate carboxy-lyase [Spirochaetaceae bacterium]|nr:3-octaprenyl-4-hydroxybenzoate carboxy-lyase [Spirochaetaceae bacterium]|tara:strand:- start:51118 stop:51804 length:687 start_codon:yes stop_codon:yes gene_type:complete
MARKTATRQNAERNQSETWSTVKNEEKKSLIIGITGASGALYAVHLINALMDHVPGQTQLIMSPSGLRVCNEEMDTNLSTAQDYLDWIMERRAKSDSLHSFSLEDYRDIGARAASGSNHHDGMAIVPCSMKTLASISHGLTQNLIERAADVTLKERRKLVVVPREAPYSLIHLRNMTSITEAGAIVLPASPGFYQKPADLDDLGRFIAGRILSSLGIQVRLFRPWLEQ